MDEYYWIGPPGWTICRVIVGGKDAFELWQTTLAQEGHHVLVTPVAVLNGLELAVGKHG